jgi:hypothetical protein
LYPVAEIVIFNHIPKTAGMTARYIMWRAVGRNRVLTSHNPSGHKAEFDQIAEKLEQPLTGQYVVQTHVGSGIENYLPSKHTYRAFTFLRDPVRRTISHFFFAREQPERWGIDSDATLSEFLRGDSLWAFNTQTAFLSGLWAKHYLEDKPVTRADLDESALQRAKQSLERHSVVGLTERFDESLLLLRREFDWPVRRTAYRSVNRGGREPSRKTITGTEIAAIRANNELDLELFDFARRLFEEKLACVGGLRFRLNGQQALNSAWRRGYGIRNRIRNLTGG